MKVFFLYFYAKIIVETYRSLGGIAMKKRKMLILAIALTFIIGGTIVIVQNKDLFGGITQQKYQSTKEKQLAYLKKHEEELADFVKALNPKVESVQFNWDSMEAGQIGNGTPQGGGYMLTLGGKVNNNDKTKFIIGLSLDNDANGIPKELEIYEMQPIRIYRDGGWYYYDEK